MHVQYAPTCAKIYILSLTVGDLGFPLSFIFHTLAVKFILLNNKIWSLQSEVTWAQEN
jgi:hypothetical protein